MTADVTADMTAAPLFHCVAARWHDDVDQASKKRAEWLVQVRKNVGLIRGMAPANLAAHGHRNGAAVVSDWAAYKTRGLGTAAELAWPPPGLAALGRAQRRATDAGGPAVAAAAAAATRAAGPSLPQAAVPPRDSPRGRRPTVRAAPARSEDADGEFCAGEQATLPGDGDLADAASVRAALPSTLKKGAVVVVAFPADEPGLWLAKVVAVPNTTAGQSGTLISGGKLGLEEANALAGRARGEADVQIRWLHAWPAARWREAARATLPEGLPAGLAVGNTDRWTVQDVSGPAGLSHVDTRLVGPVVPITKGGFVAGKGAWDLVAAAAQLQHFITGA